MKFTIEINQVKPLDTHLHNEDGIYVTKVYIKLESAKKSALSVKMHECPSALSALVPKGLSSLCAGVP